VCFSARGFCHPNCSCDDCKNSRTHKEQRLEAIQSYLANDPRAFSFSSRQQESATTAGFLQLLPQVRTICVVLQPRETHVLVLDAHPLLLMLRLAEIERRRAARVPLQEVQVPQEVLRVLPERGPPLRE